MTPVRHRSNRKIRRTGQHTAPSQAAKVAQKAEKAAPAIAVAGALTVAPQVHKPAPRGPAATVQVIHLETHLAARTLYRPGWRHSVGMRSGSRASPSRGRGCIGQPCGDHRPRADFPWTGLDVPANLPAASRRTVCLRAHLDIGHGTLRPRQEHRPPGLRLRSRAASSATPPSNSCGRPKAATRPTRHSPPVSPNTSPAVIRVQSPPQRLRALAGA